MFLSEIGIYHQRPPEGLDSNQGGSRFSRQDGRMQQSQTPMIFILDDDMATRDSLRLLLECEGLQAREFASGRAFLDTIPAGEEGCLLLDVQMPGMSGFEVLEALRRRGDDRPVIVITGHPTPAAKSRAEAAGVLAFVEKPYHADALLDLVHRALEHRPGPRAGH